MIKCPVCGKQKSAFQMRPIVNIEELKVGAAMSDQPTEQEVAGQKVDVVCRDCWMQILESRTKEEVIEILETICGVLLEADSRMKDNRWRGGDFIIEKLAHPIVQSPPPPTQPGIYINVDPPPSVMWGDRINLSNGTSGANSSNPSLTFSNGFTDWYASLHGSNTIEDED